MSWLEIRSPRFNPNQSLSNSTSLDRRAFFSLLPPSKVWHQGRGPL